MNASQYIWIVVVVALAVSGLVLANIGMEGIPPMSEILFFGGGIILGTAIICFLFKVLP